MSRLARHLLLLLVVCLGLAAALVQLTKPRVSADTIALTRSLFIKSDAPAPPDAGAAWVERTLPDNWNRSNPGQSGYGWYRLRLDLPAAPDEEWAAYLPAVATTHGLFVNGVHVGGGAMTGPYERALGKPQLNLVAQQLLHAGPNELLVRLRVAPNLRGGLGPVIVGPLAAVEPLYDQDLLVRVIVPRALNSALVFVAVLVLLLWLRRPSERIYGTFAALALVWSLRNFHYTVALRFLPSSVWEALILGSLGLVVVLQWIFMRRYTGLPPRRLERVLLAAAVLATPLFAVLAPQFVRAVRIPWYVLCAGMGVASIALLLAHLRRPQAATQAGPWVILGAMVITLLLGMSDLAVSAQLLPFGAASRMAYGAPILLCALVYALAEGYFRTYDEARALNAELEQRVQERASELQRTHERLRALERAATVTAERERLMRDMHDGIGSHLITTLDAVQRRSVDVGEVEQLLRECIDDLRLMIDSLEPEEHSLLSALGNLRYRLEPRLAAAGVRLQWDVQECSGLRSPSAVLQVLRIAQEAVTNALKHAGASRLRLALRCEPGVLELRVEDDGRGFAAAPRDGAPSARRGLNNMRMRARALGGTLEVQGDGGGGGTRIVLSVPLEPRAMAEDEANTLNGGWVS